MSSNPLNLDFATPARSGYSGKTPLPKPLAINYWIMALVITASVFIGSLLSSLVYQEIVKAEVRGAIQQVEKLQTERDNDPTYRAIKKVRGY